MNDESVVRDIGCGWGIARFGDAVDNEHSMSERGQSPRWTFGRRRCRCSGYCWFCVPSLLGGCRQETLRNVIECYGCFRAVKVFQSAGVWVWIHDWVTIVLLGCLVTIGRFCQ